jgi:hypothetical protein
MFRLRVRSPAQWQPIEVKALVSWWLVRLFSQVRLDSGHKVAKRDPISIVGSATLLLEAITIALAIPFALRSEITSRAWFVGICVVAMVVAVLATGLMRKKSGVLLGWLVQVLMFVASILVPAMLFLAVVFTSLWVTALWVASKVQKARP